MGGVPDDADRAGGHGRGRHPGRLRDAGARLCRRHRRGVLDLAAAGRSAGSGCGRGGLKMLYALPLVFALIGLALYGVLGGADFGAGFWQLTAGGGKHGERIREHAHKSMAPVWEANHVWLIFVLTVVWTAYPKAFGSIASTLCVALLIAAVGIIFRGAAYALRSGASSLAEQSTIDTAFGISSVIVPFALGAAVGGIASGRPATPRLWRWRRSWPAGRLPRARVFCPDSPSDRRRRLTTPWWRSWWRSSPEAPSSSRHSALSSGSRCAVTSTTPRRSRRLRLVGRLGLASHGTPNCSCAWRPPC